MIVSPPETRLARYPEAVAMLERGEGDERLELALAMVAAGVRGVDIAEEFEIGRSTMFALLNDPTREKDRARKKRGTCEDCGTAIYSDRPSRSPQRRCSPCQHAHERANSKWNRERIIVAFQRWNDLYGAPPTASCLNGQGSVEQTTRYRSGDFPPLAQVTKRFPRFSDALVAAGFEPRHPTAGKPRNRVSEDTYREMERLRREGMSYPELARQFGISTPAAQQRVKKWTYRTNGGTMPPSLRAETVIEREIKRFEDRKVRAEADLENATEQIERLRMALAALSNGKPA